MSRPAEKGGPIGPLSPEAAGGGGPARPRPLFEPEPRPTWRPGPKTLGFAVSLLAVVLVCAFAFAHYTLQQAPHRLWKVLAGVVLGTVFVLRPSISLWALPLAFAFKELLPKSPIPMLNAQNLLTYVLLINWLATATFQRRRLFEPSTLNRPLAALLGWFLLSWVHGELEGGYGVALHKSLQMFINQMIGFVLFYALVAHIRTARDVRRLTVWYCIATGVGVVSLVTEYMEYGGDHRVGGAIEDLNIAGAFFAMNGLFAMGMIRAQGINIWQRIAMIGATVGSVTSVLLTGSRGALLGLLGGSLPQAIRSGVIGMTIVAVLAVGLNLWAPPVIRDRMDSTWHALTGGDEGGGDFESVNDSSGGRLDIWIGVLNIAAQRPVFGVGLYRLAENLEMEIGRYKVAHNLYLELLGETGLPGLLIFIWLMRRCFKLGHALEPYGGFSGSLGSAYIFALVGLLIANIFGQRLNHFSMNGSLAFISALAVRAHQFEYEAWRVRRDAQAAKTEA